jgi:hypothetical protein
MPSTPFETVILTTAFYGVMLISLLMFSVLYQWVMIDSLRIRLGEMANQVAYEVTGLYAMCQKPRNNVDLFKPIRIPASVSEQGYAIEFKQLNGVWHVVAYLESNRAVNASSPLWSEPGGEVFVETGSGVFPVGTYLVTYSGVLHSGQRNPVVWARRINGTITVGLGWVSGGG